MNIQLQQNKTNRSKQNRSKMLIIEVGHNNETQRWILEEGKVRQDKHARML